MTLQHTHDGIDYVTMPATEYNALTEHLSDDEYDEMLGRIAAIRADEEAFPLALFNQIGAGTNPITVLREYRRLSKAALGVAIGKTGQYISMIEKDEREPTLSTLRDIAKALSVELTMLIEA